MSKLKIVLSYFLFTVILNFQLHAQSNKIHKIHIGNKSIILRGNQNSLNYSDSSFVNSFFFFGETNNKKENSFIRMDSLLTFYNGSFSLKNLFKYNQNLKISESILQSYFGSDWENSLKDNYIYENNQMVSDISLGWNQNVWDSLNYIEYRYNTEGFLSRYVFQNYINEEWSKVTKTTNNYDSLNNLVFATDENWKFNQWHNSYLINYYNSAKNKKDSLLFRTWGDGQWRNFRKSIFYYSDELQNQLDSIVGKSWTGTTWKNLIKVVYAFYDINGNLIEQIDKLWNNNWQNSIKYLYSYNEYSLLKTAVCRVWYNNNWVQGIGVIEISYDNFHFGFFTEGLTVYYSVITDVQNDNNASVNSFKLYQNYPNPFNPSTIIRYAIPENSFVKVNVYNVLGKEIETLVNAFESKGNYQVTFNSKKLSSGIYIYRISATNETGSFSKTKKMILVR